MVDILINFEEWPIHISAESAKHLFDIDIDAFDYVEYCNLGLVERQVVQLLDVEVALVRLGNIVVIILNFAEVKCNIDDKKNADEDGARAA